jgi:hypothetical protein
MRLSELIPAGDLVVVINVSLPCRSHSRMLLASWLKSKVSGFSSALHRDD